MQEKFEQAARDVYQSWRADQKEAGAAAHPEEEELVCFLEGSLTPEEREALQQHLIACARCSQSLALQVKVQEAKEIAVPKELLVRVKNAGSIAERLEVFLKAKDKVFELISTTADVLLGQEVVPAPVLRSRNIKDFKDEISILKDFQVFRVEIRVVNKGDDAFAAQVSVKEKQTSKPLKDIRVSLLKAEVELESYLAESGTVTFEHLRVGSYVIVLAAPDNYRAYVILAIAV